MMQSNTDFMRELLGWIVILVGGFVIGLVSLIVGDIRRYFREGPRRRTYTRSHHAR